MTGKIWYEEKEKFDAPPGSWNDSYSHFVFFLFQILGRRSSKLVLVFSRCWLWLTAGRWGQAAAPLILFIINYGCCRAVLCVAVNPSISRGAGRTELRYQRDTLNAGWNEFPADFQISIYIWFCPDMLNTPGDTGKLGCEKKICRFGLCLTAWYCCEESSENL